MFSSILTADNNTSTFFHFFLNFQNPLMGYILLIKLFLLKAKIYLCKFFKVIKINDRNVLFNVDLHQASSFSENG